MARVPVLVLGGTFDRLHVGHEAVLNSAFRLGRDVGIGLTTEEFLRSRTKPLRTLIEPYSRRRRDLAAWLRRHHPGRTWWIAPLENPFGRSVEPGVDAIVVSADTADGGRAVNRERRRRGLPPAVVHLVPLVLADDFQPVSSRRIRAGTIDRSGRRLSRIPIRAQAPDVVRAAIRAALRATYRRPSIHWSRPETAHPAAAAKGRERHPTEIELAVRPADRTRTAWIVSVRAGRIRLPPIRVLADRPTAVREAIVELLRPRPARD